MDTDKDGIISKKEAETTHLKDFFDNQDANKDGQSRATSGTRSSSS